MYVFILCRDLIGLQAPGHGEWLALPDWFRIISFIHILGHLLRVKRIESEFFASF